MAVFVVFYQYNQQIADELMAKYEAIEAERLNVRKFSSVIPDPDRYGAFIMSVYMVLDIDQCVAY